MNQLNSNSILRPPDCADPAAYENDFALWIERQAEFLRAQNFEQLDLANVIEEIESMGRSQRHELRSRIETILLHLLKCQFQPEHTTRSWLATLSEQRSQVSQRLEDSPSLANDVADYAAKRYPVAVQRAMVETGLPQSTFPDVNPYSTDELLDPAFLP